jgi:hypothetical protein
MTEDLVSSMNISMSGILSALIFGVIGMYVFGRGKKRSSFKLILIAIGLMVYPYFTSGPVGDWGVGFLLCGCAYYFWWE